MEYAWGWVKVTCCAAISGGWTTFVLFPIRFAVSVIGADSINDALGLGCLICGFFLEIWNYLFYPKWTYRIPFVDYYHVFEMSFLGYGGYVPFSLELFALYHLVMGGSFRLNPDRSSFWFDLQTLTTHESGGFWVEKSRPIGEYC